MVSRKTIARMSLYRRLLISLREDGTSHVFSHQLAKLAGLTAAQVRRDFMAIGYSGSPTRGYEVGKCIDSIGGFLDGPRRQDVALVGAGKLGRSIISHFSGRRPKLAIVAAFDDDPAKVEGRIDGCRCFPVDIMESTVRDLGIQIAIVATPPAAAQKATDALVRAGVRSIVSFAATPLQAPEGVSIIDMDITAALETAAYIARETPAAVAAEAEADVDKAAAPLLRQLDTLLAGNEVRLDELARRIGAQIVSGDSCPQRVVEKIYAGDRVSDLLNEASDRTLLVTNLMSLQMIRVAELMDVPAICFVNGVCPEPDIVAKADSTGTTLMVSPIGVFETCGLIYQSLAAAPATAPTARV
jgi:redox-sensing transcriptional repressor